LHESPTERQTNKEKQKCLTSEYYLIIWYQAHVVQEVTKQQF